MRGTGRGLRAADGHPEGFPGVGRADRLAEVLAKELLSPVHYRPVETDGAARAAALLAALL